MTWVYFHECEKKLAILPRSQMLRTRSNLVEVVAHQANGNRHIMPPSITIACPVMYDESGEIKNIARLA